MINILYYGLSDNAGGIERYLFRIATHLNKKEFCINFIDEHEGNLCYKKELEQLGAKFYSVVPRRQNPLKNKRQIKELFQKNHFDILHCNINTLSYIEPIMQALRAGCKVIVHSRNSGNNERFLTRFLHKMHFIMLPKKRIIPIAVSQEAGEWLFGKRGIFTVYHNGIDIEKFRFQEDARKRIRTELKLENKIVLGHVGFCLLYTS